MTRYLIFIFLLFVLCHPETGNAQPSELVRKVLPQLKLRFEDLYEPLITEKQLPAQPDLSVLVLPKTADSSEDFFALDSYILLADNKTGHIISQYTEDHETNGWSSDAIRLEEITIDTAPYLLRSGIRAFGIRVGYNGSSSVNPYSNTILSLFILQGKRLLCVLKNYPVSTYSGEWDTRCTGASTLDEQALQIAPTMTNGYYDILVKSEITNTTTTPVKDDCVEKITRQKKQKTLRFRNGLYR